VGYDKFNWLFFYNPLLHPADRCSYVHVSRTDSDARVCSIHTTDSSGIVPSPSIWVTLAS